VGVFDSAGDDQSNDGEEDRDEVVNASLAEVIRREEEDEETSRGCDVNRYRV
jgi:hypothetical protein